MERKYLLKVIEKHFWALSKEEIAEQITESKLGFSDDLVKALKEQDPRLDVAANLSTLNSRFSGIIKKVIENIEKNENYSFPFLWGVEEDADAALLLISIYYHYCGCIGTALMADFIRLVLLKKLLLT